MNARANPPSIAEEASFVAEFAGAPFRRAPQLNLADVATGGHLIPTTGSAEIIYIVERCGILTELAFGSDTALVQDDTNYVSFTAENKGPLGTTTIKPMLAAGDINSTKLAGSGITALKRRALALHGTTSNLLVVRGDMLKFRVPINGTLSAPLRSPILQLAFSTIDARWNDVIERTAGFPSVLFSGGVANGAHTISVDATNEAQVAGLNWAGNLAIVANRRWRWRSRLRLSSLPNEGQQFWCGVFSAYANPFANMVTYAAFQVLPGGALWYQSDDNATNAAAVNTGITLTAGVSDYFDFEIDSSDLSAVAFRLNGVPLGTTNMAALGNQRLEPAWYAQREFVSGGGPGFAVVVDDEQSPWGRN